MVRGAVGDSPKELGYNVHFQSATGRHRDAGPSLAVPVARDRMAFSTGLTGTWRSAEVVNRRRAPALPRPVVDALPLLELVSPHRVDLLPASGSAGRKRLHTGALSQRRDPSRRAVTIIACAGREVSVSTASGTATLSVDGAARLRLATSSCPERGP